MADGIHSSYAATPTDYERIFKAYPNCSSGMRTPISPDLTIQPGETKEGTFVMFFPHGQSRTGRRARNWTTPFNFQYLPALTLAPKGPITER